MNGPGMAGTKATWDGHASQVGFTKLTWLWHDINRVIITHNQDHEIQLKKYNAGILFRRGSFQISRSVDRRLAHGHASERRR